MSLSSSPRKLLQKNQVYESNGHAFKTKSNAPSVPCFHCNDTLFGSNQTLECSGKRRGGDGGDGRQNHNPFQAAMLLATSSVTRSSRKLAKNMSSSGMQ